MKKLTLIIATGLLVAAGAAWAVDDYSFTINPGSGSSSSNAIKPLKQYSVVCETANARYKICSGACTAGTNDYLIYMDKPIDIGVPAGRDTVAVYGVGGSPVCRFYIVTPGTLRGY
jgi:hypothetical protein